MQRLAQPRLQRDLEKNHQQDVRQGIEHIDDPHQKRIDPTPAIPGHQPHAHPQRHADRRRRQPDRQADHPPRQTLPKQALAQQAGAEPKPGGVGLGRKKRRIGALPIEIKIRRGAQGPGQGDDADAQENRKDAAADGNPEMLENPKSEIRMTNQIRSPNDECVPVSDFVIRA